MPDPRPASREERQQFARAWLAALSGYKRPSQQMLGRAMDDLDRITRAMPGSVLVSALLGNDHTGCEICGGRGIIPPAAVGTRHEAVSGPGTTHRVGRTMRLAKLPDGRFARVWYAHQDWWLDMMGEKIKQQAWRASQFMSNK